MNKLFTILLLLAGIAGHCQKLKQQFMIDTTPIDHHNFLEMSMRPWPGAKWEYHYRANFNLYDSVTHQSVTFEKTDSLAPWKCLKSGVDSATLVNMMLDFLCHQFERQNKEFQRQDSATTKAYLIATRWANVCKQICQQYGINEDEFIQVMKKAEYVPENLYNKPRKKRRA